MVTVLHIFNPLSANNDEDEISLYTITTCSNIQVTRTRATITKEEMSRYLDKFSSLVPYEMCGEQYGEHIRAYSFPYPLAHMNRVSGVIFSLENEWLLSVGRDKYLQWHDCTNGKRLGGYQTEAWCTSLQYPFIKHLPVKLLHRMLQNFIRVGF